MLASDDHNPEFVGAKNPDDALAVEFYDFQAVDEWATREQYERTGDKTPVLKKECPFVRISIPGNNLNIVERPADGRDVNRFPRQWLYYQMSTGKIANAGNVPGMQIDAWEDVSPEIRRQLKFLRFVTVEQLAGATDAQIQGIGMGAERFREQAKQAIAQRNRMQVSKEVQERDQKIEEQAQQLKALQAQMDAFMARLNPTQEIPGHLADARPDEPKKRGRPAKEAA